LWSARRISQWVPIHAAGGKFAALAILQKSLGDTERAAKTGNDSTDGRNFDLCRRVTNQIDFPIADLPAHRHPSAVDRDARALPFERFEMLLFEEAFEAAFGVAAVLADHAERSAFRRFGINQ